MSDDVSSQGIRLPIKLVVVTNLIAFGAAASLVILAYIGIFPFQDPLGLYRILPGDILMDFIWVWIIAGFTGILTYLVTPYLANFFIMIHRIQTRGMYEYHIQAREDVNDEVDLSRSLIVPAFVSLGFSLTLVNMSQGPSSLFVTENFDSLPTGVAEPLLASMPILFVLILIAGFISIVFAPAWLLEDMGIICEKKVVGGTSDIEGIGNWYLTLLKGFAGISTILAYVFISMDMITWFQLLPTYTVEVPIWLFLIPVVVVVLSPLFALAPISVSYLFYVRAYKRNSLNLSQQLNRMGVKKATVEVKSTDH